MEFKSILILLFIFMAPLLEATPAQVILIRHGEKPPVGNGLSPEGQNRALALVSFFTKAPEVLKYGLPVAIYAPRPGTEDSSVRSIQTMTPLASALKLSIHTDYEHEQYAQMVEEVKSNPAYTGKMVLICWEHKDIPEIARAFGAEGALRKWHGDVFDRAWLLTFEPGGRVAFEEIPER